MLEQSAIENNSTEPIEENGRYDFDGSDYVALSTSGFGYKTGWNSRPRLEILPLLFQNSVLILFI